MSLQPREYTRHQQIRGQKIHIFYIKKITDLTNVFEDKKKKKLMSFEGWERRNLKWNS